MVPSFGPVKHRRPRPVTPLVGRLGWRRGRARTSGRRTGGPVGHGERGRYAAPGTGGLRARGGRRLLGGGRQTEDHPATAPAGEHRADRPGQPARGRLRGGLERPVVGAGRRAGAGAAGGRRRRGGRHRRAGGEVPAVPGAPARRSGGRRPLPDVALVVGVPGRLTPPLPRPAAPAHVWGAAPAQRPAGVTVSSWRTSSGTSSKD